MNTPLTVYYSPDGLVDPETGTRGPAWTSDAHSPAPSLRRMSEVLMESGWGMSTELRFVGCDREECRLSDLYKAEHDGKLPSRAFEQFRREQKAREWAQNNGDPYGLRLPSGATSGARPNYGTTKKI
jgi:hypothetical protein